MTAKHITLALPDIGLIAMTPGALGVGIGLLLGNGLEKMNDAAPVWPSWLSAS